MNDRSDFVITPEDHAISDFAMTPEDCAIYWGAVERGSRSTLELMRRGDMRDAKLMQRWAIAQRRS